MEHGLQLMSCDIVHAKEQAVVVAMATSFIGG